VVHIYDPSLKTLILALDDGSFLLISTKTAELKIISVPESPVTPNVPLVNMEEIFRRERKAIEKREQEAKKIGPAGISDKVQSLFDELDKSMSSQVRWQGEDIVVMDTIVIKSPYTVNEISGGPRASLTRVKKVVEGLRTKLHF